jgi:hypothetical protein
MRTNRTIIITVMIALGAVGSIDASVTVSAKVAPTPVIRVVPGPSCANPQTYLV